MDVKLIAFAVLSFIICVISVLATGLKPWGHIEIDSGGSYYHVNLNIGLWRSSADGKVDGKGFDDDGETIKYLGMDNDEKVDENGRAYDLLDDRTKTLKSSILGNRGTTIIAVIGTFFGTIVFGAMASGIIENNTRHVIFLGILYMLLGTLVIIFGIMWTTSFQEKFDYSYSEVADDIVEISNCVVGCGLDFCAGVLLLTFGILVIIQPCFSPSNAGNNNGAKISDVELPTYVTAPVPTQPVLVAPVSVVQVSEVSELSVPATFCGSCGTKGDGNAFCGNCGTRIGTRL